MGKDYVYGLYEDGHLQDVYKKEKDAEFDRKSLKRRFPNREYDVDRIELHNEAVWGNEDR